MRPTLCQSAPSISEVKIAGIFRGQVLVSRAGSTGRCNTIWYKADFKGGVYDPRETVWTFCHAEERHVAALEGGTVVACDRARLRQGAFVHSLSGIASRWVCSDGPAALASGSSIREIARRLDRVASTVSREIARHGGRPVYRANEADQQAWESALRPKRCLLSNYV